MTSDELGEMFEGDFADMCAKKCQLMSMGVKAEGLACKDLVARTFDSASDGFSSDSEVGEVRYTHR